MFDSGEQKLVDTINYYLTCGPLDWGVLNINKTNGFIKFKVMKNATIELKIELLYSEKNTLRTVVWKRDTSDNDLGWGWPVYQEHLVPVPESEEEYFQLSTVENLVYSFEFFQYIKNVLTDSTIVVQ